MKRKILLSLLMITSMVSISACGSKSETGAELSATVESTQEEKSVEEISVEEAATADDNQESNTILYESPLGYSMEYNPDEFTLTSEGSEQEDFTYCGEESTDAPVYIGILSYPDMDYETLINGVALQSGKDDVVPYEAYFGAEGIDTQSVYIQEEVNGITQIIVGYAIPMGEGSLYVEMGGYVGQSEKMDWLIEEMLGTFTITSDT